MDNKSKLEKLPKKILFKICKKILKRCENSDANWDDVYEYAVAYEVYEKVLKQIGLDYFTNDIDFLFNVIKLNLGVLENDDENSDLKLPKYSMYYINVDVRETIQQTTTYGNTFDSYCDDPDVAELKFRYEEQIGELSLYDGEITHTDVHDSESHNYYYRTPEKID
jgi:hypothetical protein